MSPRAPLSRQRIVDAAVEYIDGHCLDELSMRRLGAVLGVEAMSLYRYFPSKAALLDDVLCRVLTGLRLPTDADADWESAVLGYARSFRGVAREHPRLFPLLATAAPLNQTMGDVVERMLDMWQRIGLDQQQAARAHCAVQGFITGATLWEVGSEDRASAGIALDAEMLGHEAHEPQAPAATDAEFEFGLRVLLAGLRETLGPPPARPG